jgi:hypothetical protein
MPSSICRQAHSDRQPACRSAQYFQTSDPLPRRVVRNRPASIGPAGRKMAGRSTEIAPRRSPGTVLSQPPMRTTPSIGWLRSTSSTSRARRLRWNIAVGLTNISDRERTGISTGKPPACQTPRFTSSARSRKCVWHWARSLQVLRTAITGRSRSSSPANPIWAIRLRCPKLRRSSGANQARERSCSGDFGAGTAGKKAIGIGPGDDTEMGQAV